MDYTSLTATGLIFDYFYYMYTTISTICIRLFLLYVLTTISTICIDDYFYYNMYWRLFLLYVYDYFYYMYWRLFLLYVLTTISTICTDDYFYYMYTTISTICIRLYLYLKMLWLLLIIIFRPLCWVWWSQDIIPSWVLWTLTIYFLSGCLNKKCSAFIGSFWTPCILMSILWDIF